jgi:type II secretory pathway pseudopilin PulG
VLNISSGLTEAIAIVSILSGAAVAIVVPFISARLERSRMKQQSREARTAELHALLDGAAQHLYEAWTILYEVEQVPRELPRPEWSDQQLRKLSDRLTEHVDTLSLDSIRISVRTSKRSPVTAAFYRARGPIDGYELEFRRFRESERRELDMRLRHFSLRRRYEFEAGRLGKSPLRTRSHRRSNAYALRPAASRTPSLESVLP